MDEISHKKRTASASHPWREDDVTLDELEQELDREARELADSATDDRSVKETARLRAKAEGVRLALSKVQQWRREQASAQGGATIETDGDSRVLGYEGLPRCLNRHGQRQPPPLPASDEVERLTAILLHVNNSLAGADQDTEHQIDSHADTLPQYTRSLALAIEVAHGPVNDWLQARVWKEPPPPLLACAADCRCLDQAEEVRCRPPEPAEQPSGADCVHSSVSIDRAQGTETCDDCGADNPQLRTMAGCTHWRTEYAGQGMMKCQDCGALRKP